jgi:hypothetical protein
VIFSEKKWIGVLGLLAVVAGGLFLFCFAPDKTPFYPRCAFHAMTGWDCPGCGGLRAAHYLLHGQLALALHYNALLVVALPLLLGALCYYLYCRAYKRPRPDFFRYPVVIWFVVGFILLFGVLRNLPFAPFNQLHV